MRRTHQLGETFTCKRFRYGQIEALVSSIVLAVCICTFFVQPVSAVTWTSSNGCWTATNGNQNLIMWNVSGVNSWTVPTGLTNLSVLVVAGGGGGGSSTGASNAAGGGGAGEIIINTSYTVSGGVLNVTVGGGGNGGASSALNYGTNGSNSVFGAITALGGGGGAAGSSAKVGTAGGSGGGGAMGGTGGTATNGALAGGTGYGYNGGSSSTTTKYGGGGGGGAGSTGGGGSGSAAGAGGTGTSNSITGTATYYGGGGGGGIVSTGTIGTGGSSIGGSGGDLGSSPTNAAASTGSGGGGAGGKTAAGGTGAGGVIIVSYTQLPGASFTMNTTSGYSPLAVSFTDTSNPVGTSWQWGFNNVTGNNTWTNFATTENPVWTFGIGNYSVNLTATNSGGSSKFTNTTFINVTAVPPVAAFTMNTTAGYSPLAVSFTDTSNPVGTAWQWGFNNVTGNNTWTNFATTENPVWTFGIGNYSVNLTATNSGGSSKFTNTTFINVTAVPPVASFTVSPISGIPPLGISLNDTSTNTPTSWSWGAKNVTGNNTWIPIGNRLQNDVAMLGSGNWSINLTAANSGGSNISTQISFVNVSGIVPLPIGNFTENGLYTQTSGNAPFPVQFNYVQSNGTTSWFWMFGDGSTSTDQNPLHTYTVAGIYTVNHSVTNSFGTGWTNRTGAVMAIMVSMFTPWPGPVTRWYPAGVYFQDQSAGSPTSVNWSFGDGTIANLTTAIYHQFPHSAASQVYTITETACTASACSTNSSIVQIHPT